MIDLIDVNEKIQTIYKNEIVLFSYFISFLGAFVALTAAQRIRDKNYKINNFNLTVSSIALGGISVWSMHFTGMMALNIGMGSGYNLAETIISLLVAIFSTFWALAYVAKDSSNIRILIAGGLLGIGVASMHYIGMLGMRFPGYIVWSWDIIALSVWIAVVAASVALWLAFRTTSLGMRFVAAMMMGAAVCCMHYTGMAAADFICTSPFESRFAIPQDPFVISAIDLPAITIAFSIGMALLIAYEQLLQINLIEK